MSKLTNNKYWDTIYESQNTSVKEVSKTDHRNKLEKKLEKIIGKRFASYFHNYSDYYFWDVILVKHLKYDKNIKALEVGSAPGTFMIRLHKTFGFIPYGVEYTKTGVELNRRLFASEQINPENVIEADFLSEDFHSKYRESFDVVLSNGFIEHFDNPNDIVAKHLSLLKKDGLLLISIPNIRGLNYLCTWFFNKPVIPIHNIEIMDLNKFNNLFDRDSVCPIFDNYYGTFNFRLFTAPLKSFKRFILVLLHTFQLGLNFVFRFLFGKRGFKNKYLSPYLLFIGIKK